MDYEREINGFRDWVLMFRPSTGEVALWHSLMSLASAAFWPDEFSAPSQTLQLLTGLSRQGLDRARQQLMKRGLITYKPASGRASSIYSVISFECQKTGTTVGTNFDRQNIGTKRVTKRTQGDTQSGHNADSHNFECQKTGTTVGTTFDERVSSYSALSTKDLSTTTATTDDDNNAHAETNESPYLSVDVLPDLYDEIEKSVGPRFLNRQMLSPDEFMMLKDLVANGIEKDTIMDGIARAFEKFTLKYPSKKHFSSLRYCEGPIRDLHDIKSYKGREREGREIGQDRRNTVVRTTTEAPRSPAESITGGRVGWIRPASV